MLLRVGRRRTAWELGEVDTIINTEFRNAQGVELQASVYDVSAEQVTRAVAEHGASNRLGMRGFDNIDLEAGREVHRNPGDSEFEFTRGAHRELHFKDVDDLRRFLLEEILPTISQRKHIVPRAKIKQYVSERLAEGDPEWTAFQAANGNWPT